MKSMDIINYSIKPYSEATEANDPHLSILYTADENNFELLFPCCRCKDYFNEVFNKVYTGRDADIYSFNTVDIDVSKIKDSEYFYLLMVPRNVDIPIENIQAFLDIFSPQTFVFETIVENKRSAIVKFHRNWTDRPYILSMFINLCRIGTIYSGQSWEEFKKYITTNTLIKQQHVGLACIRQVGKSLCVIEDYLKGIIHEQSFEQYDTSTHGGVIKLHNYSGAVSFSKELQGASYCDEDYEEDDWDDDYESSDYNEDDW